MSEHMKEWIRKNKAVLLTTLAILILAGVFLLRFERQKDGTPALSTAPAAPAVVTLHISGEVRQPGSYAIPLGSSLADNLETFGGFTDQANLDEVKLEEPITKEKSIQIKSRKDHGLDPNEIEELYRAP